MNDLPNDPSSDPGDGVTDLVIEGAKRKSRFTMNGKGGDGIKLALPLVIQILVIVGGGIAFYFQMTNSVRADLSDSKIEIIRKVDKTENKVDELASDVSEVKAEQRTLKKEILDQSAKDLDAELLRHKVDCHNSKSTKCDPP